MAAVGLTAAGGGKYNAIQSEEEASLIPRGAGAPPPKLAKKKKRKKRKKRKSCLRLLFNASFLFFLVNILAPFAIFAWWYVLYPDVMLPYVVAGLQGMLVTFTGYRKFRAVLQLNQHANGFEANNAKMRKQHHEIRTQVSNIRNARQNLGDTQQRLRAANAKNAQNLNNFRDVQSFMSDMKIEDFQEVSSKAAMLVKSWRSELLQQERNMLHLIFDRYEMNNEKSKKGGMNKQDFEKFAKCLPDNYQTRFARLGTFEKLTDDNDILEYQDFELVLDVFAEMAVDDVDIDLEIVRDAPMGGALGAMSVQESTLSDEDTDDEYGSRDRTTSLYATIKNWRSSRTRSDARSAGKKVIRKSISRTPRASQFKMLFEAKEKEEADLKKQKMSEKEKRRQERQAKRDKRAQKLGQPRKEMQRTASQLDAIVSHNTDPSLNDDEISAYMAAQNKS